MPSTYDAQALMAQAVCARTFAYAQMHNGTYADYGANIDDSTAYQVYNSGGTYESTDKAVKDTGTSGNNLWWKTYNMLLFFYITRNDRGHGSMGFTDTTVHKKS